MPRIFKYSLFFLVFFSPWTLAAPAWFTAPSQSQQEVAATGMGESLSKAKQDALTQLSQSLYSKVSTNLSQNIETENNQLKNKQSQHQYSIVSDTELSLVTWTHTEEEDGIFYVRTSMNLAQWVATKENQLANDLIAVRYVLNKPNWTLADFSRSQKIDIANIQKTTSMIAPFSTVSSNANRSLQQLKEKQLHYLNNECFFVEDSRDTLSDKYIKPVIESAVHLSQLTLKESTECRRIKYLSRNNQIASGHLNTTILIHIEGEMSYQVKVEGKGASYKSSLISVSDALAKVFQQQGGIVQNTANVN